LEQETKSGAWGHGKFNGVNNKFTDAAIDLLSHFDITEKTCSNFDIDFLQPVIRFFTCLTDHRLKFSLVMPRRISTKADGDFAFTDIISDHTWIAVPTALAHLPFYHTRAWLVEPFEPPVAGGQSAVPPPKLASLENEVAATDLFPVLSSDFADQRNPPNSAGTWRLRKRQTLVGCQPIAADEQAVVLLKNQRVYGSRDYDWKAMNESYSPR
jgi:hypothetical protein